jgi:hypothetical protein
VTSERRSVEKQLIEYCGWACFFGDVLRGDLRSTAPKLSISQKALGTLLEDGNIMPKHVGTTIHN